MDVQEVGGGGGDWMELAQDRDRNWEFKLSFIKTLYTTGLHNASASLCTVPAIIF
jgi:hypothetical protein